MYGNDRKVNDFDFAAEEDALRQAAYDDYARIEKNYRGQRSGPVHKYRLLPITLAGILIFALSLFLLGLLWSAFAFLLNKDPGETLAVAYIIYFLALAAGCFTAAALCRGVSILPSCLTALFAVASNLLLSGTQEPALGGLIFKTLLSLLVALLAAVIGRSVGRREESDINLRGELHF